MNPTYTSSISPKPISSFSAAKEQDSDEICNMVELVIGCAVRCENKAAFIQNIFSLDHTSQTVLKGMVESAMRRTSPLSAFENSEDISAQKVGLGNDEVSDELLR